MPEAETNDKLEKLYKEAQEDFKLTVVNLSEKTRQVPTLKNKWIFRIVNEEKLLSKMKDTQQDMISKLTSFSSKVKNGSIKVKAESMKQDELIRLSGMISEQEEVVKFLRLLLDNQIKSFTWDIKNALEQAKLENI